MGDTQALGRFDACQICWELPKMRRFHGLFLSMTFGSALMLAGCPFTDATQRRLDEADAAPSDAELSRDAQLDAHAPDAEPVRDAGDPRDVGAFDAEHDGGVADAEPSTDAGEPNDVGTMDADLDGGVADGGVVPDGMVRVPAGAFLAGCTFGQGVYWLCDAGSVMRTVQLDDFYIDRTEVTVRAFQDCVDAGACQPAPCEDVRDAGPNEPKTCVFWSDAIEYCAWRGARLPSEDEWEKAARGTDGRGFPWGDDYDDSGVSNINRFGWTHVLPVGSLGDAGASPYGLVDMSGNAFEFVAAPGANYAGVRRGGSFIQSPAGATTYHRNEYDGAVSANAANGFRCAWPPRDAGP